MQQAFRSYIDVPTFIAQGMGGPVGIYLGGNTYLTAPCASGANTLTVASTEGFRPGQMVYILDGPLSERVILQPAGQSTEAIGDDYTLNLSLATVNAHSAGASISSGSTRGDLGQMLQTASGWVENYLQHGTIQDRGIFLQSRTEINRMPSTRAYVDNQYNLNIWPRHFPVTAISAIEIIQAQGATYNFDPTQALIDSTGKSFFLPVMRPLAGSPVNVWLDFPPLGRNDYAQASLTYTAGLDPNNLPSDFVLACAYAVQEILMAHENPSGAARASQEGISAEWRLRGSGGKESSADGLWMTKAKFLLENYRVVPV